MSCERVHTFVPESYKKYLSKSHVIYELATINLQEYVKTINKYII